ncbi:hypothetical protein [Cyclobacterium jeungdonense]|uniref:Lipoprotein n=1 Tax=Cyclobacterium jeungdonense TaxID=708087 RepID=A0ABT8CEI4_9BACT|nr:hypothetical protein [Cyclobacterium jeungdonense]MDN3690477.1 hypothetical protein [Cyclobacterium jeungdonense]
MNKRAKVPGMLSIGLSLILLTNSCYYYKPVTQPVSSYSFDSSEKGAKLEYRALILRSPQKVYLLTNFSFDLNEEKLRGTLAEVPREHFTYLTNQGQSDRYKIANDAVLQEVHLYTDLADLGSIGDRVEISISDINKLEVIEKNKGKSAAVTILAAAGVTVGILAVIMVILILTKSSCPFISVYDGEKYVLQGETFGGAIIPALAREDFLPLPDLSMGKDLKLMISNELKERQYTDMADLMVVAHNPDERVFSDPFGNLFKSNTFYKPTHASINQEVDMLFPLSEVDNIACTFNDDQNDSVNELYVHFDHPDTKKQHGLLLSVKNNYWLEYMIAEFYRAFGKKYSKFVAKQQKKSGDEILEWMDQQEMMLTVEAKTERGWKEVQKIKTIGPLMNREVLLPLEDIAFLDEGLEVRLRTGFMFWELDKITLTELAPIATEKIEMIKPTSAIDEKDQDVLSPLLENDGIFMEQPEVGNRAYLTYRFENYNPNQTYSAFLHSRGFYEPIREFKGKADRKFLTQFRKDGMLPAFSLQRYLEISQSQYLTDQSPKGKPLRLLKKRN